MRRGFAGVCAKDERFDSSAPAPATAAPVRKLLREGPRTRETDSEMLKFRLSMAQQYFIAAPCCQGMGPKQAVVSTQTPETAF